MAKPTSWSFFIVFFFSLVFVTTNSHAISIKLKPITQKKAPEKKTLDKKSVDKKIVKALPPSSAIPKKIVTEKKVKPIRMAFEPSLWRARLLTLPGQIPVASGAAISIDRDWLILRLEEPPSLASLEINSAILLQRGNLQLWAELKDIELEHGWVLAYSKGHNSSAGPVNWSFLKSQHRDFGFKTEETFKSSWSSFQKLQDSVHSRAPSSVGNLKDNIERRWVELSNQFSGKFRNSRSRLAIGNFAFGPAPTTSQCRVTSTTVKDANIAKKLGGGSALECSEEKNESSPFSPHYQIQVGSLKLLPSSAHEPDSAILNSLSERWRETFSIDSSQVESSTSPFCTSAQISNTNQLVISCVRGLRPLADVFDSLFVLGQRQSDQFHYTLLRLNGFGSNSSKEILNLYLHAMSGGSR